MKGLSKTNGNQQHERSIQNKLMPEKENSQKTFTVRERIGSTIFEVSVRFSEKSSETLEDKILKLLEREVRDIAS